MHNARAYFWGPETFLEKRPMERRYQALRAKITELERQLAEAADAVAAKVCQIVDANTAIYEARQLRDNAMLQRNQLEVQLVDANDALYAAGKTVGEQFKRIKELEAQIAAKDAALVERITDAAWETFGGNHMPADVWNEFGSKVEAALSRPAPAQEDKP